MLGAGFEEFVAIVDGGSVTAAAKALGLPRPTVSKRLARLEERLGVRLLHRTTRRMDLTREGALFLERARRVVYAAREAEAEIQRLDGVPRGLLRVLIPPRVPAGPFTQWLSEFMAAYPEVRLDVVGTDVHVDMVAEGFDVAMRFGVIEDTSLIGRTLVANQIIAVASPDYLARCGTPTLPADLAEHNCIISYTGSNVPERRWPLMDGGWTHVSGHLMTNHDGLRVEAAMRHLGIAMVIKRVVDAHLTAGRLVWVLPEAVGRRDLVRLVYPERRFLDPKVRAFVNFITSRVDARHRTVGLR
ncbi:MAG: LysR family transcriptional regulator [Myxococcales bacterium]|nr:LysR family transcriptional regulator [Myxococcales bacterium]